MSEAQSPPPAPPMVKIISSCRDCVFARYEGDTQEGCAVGRVDAFEARGATITGYDDGRKQFLTIDRYCNMQHAADSKYLRGIPSHQWADHIRDFVKVRAAYIVLAAYSCDADDVRLSLRWASESAIPPAEILLGLDDASEISPPAARGLIAETGLSVPWKIVRLEPGDEVSETLYPQDEHRLLDQCVSSLDEDAVTYYVPVLAGNRPADDLLTLIDRAINDRMIPLGVVEGHHHGWVAAAQTKLHNHPEVVGNKGVPLDEKLPWIIETYGEGVRVLDLEELKREAA